MGCVQTVNIDKTDGFQIYLSKDSLHADLVTAKSSEMNVLIPTDDGDFVSSSDTMRLGQRDLRFYDHRLDSGCKHDNFQSPWLSGGECLC